MPSDFRPQDRPAQPLAPNAVCRACGWLREVSWAAEPPPCQSCGDDRVDRLTGRALFLCRACGGLRLDAYGCCPVCRSEPPEQRPAPLSHPARPDPRAEAEARSARKRKNFLKVIAGAMLDRAEADTRKTPADKSSS